MITLLLLPTSVLPVLHTVLHTVARARNNWVERADYLLFVFIFIFTFLLTGLPLKNNEKSRFSRFF